MIAFCAALAYIELKAALGQKLPVFVGSLTPALFNTATQCNKHLIKKPQNKIQKNIQLQV